jgi:hypothetical protein
MVASSRAEGLLPIKLTSVPSNVTPALGALSGNKFGLSHENEINTKQQESQQPAETRPAAGDEGKQVKPEVITVADIPADLEITTTAVHENTGNPVRLKENARAAFTRVQADIDAFQEVQNCLG